METTLTLDINTDYLVDEIAQRDPHFFQELHYDRQAVKQAIETLLHILMMPSDPIIPRNAPTGYKGDVFHLPPPKEEDITPDSSIWLP